MLPPPPIQLPHLESRLPQIPSESFAQIEDAAVGCRGGRKGVAPQPPFQGGVWAARWRMELTLSFSLRAFSFPFDPVQFMKNGTHVFLVNFYTLTEMGTFFQEAFYVEASFRFFQYGLLEWGAEKGHPPPHWVPISFILVAC